MAEHEVRKYLFVCGCPRSGTTALWRLLTQHTDIMLGVERFGLRWIPNRFSLSPDLFVKERFFSVQPEDTFYNDLESFNSYYAQIKNNYENHQYFGDKIPKLYMSYKQLFSAFPNAKVVFIFRNIFDVANSYNKRARDLNDDTWRRSQDYREAVVDWNRSLTNTIQAMDQGFDIHCVGYEALWAHDGYEQNVRPLLKHLCLDESDNLIGTYNQLRRRHDQLESERSVSVYLTEMEKVHLLSTASIGPYRKLLERAALGLRR